jgi:hypothetical protein
LRAIEQGTGEAMSGAEGRGQHFGSQKVNQAETI